MTRRCRRSHCYYAAIKPAKHWQYDGREPRTDRSTDITMPHLHLDAYIRSELHGYYTRSLDSHIASVCKVVIVKYSSITIIIVSHTTHVLPDTCAYLNFINELNG